MARTQGHGNPDWTRDEVILALDLYFDCDGRIPVADDPRVVLISQTLRALPIHADAARNDRFRNPEGVVFKVGNLRSVATGKGLGNVAAGDRAAWKEFGDKPDVVRSLAAHIRSQTQESELVQRDVAAVGLDEEFAEGRILTALHKTRERHPMLRKRLLAGRRSVGPLRCDACEAGPSVADPQLSDAAFEAHHVEPLAARDRKGTRVSELALLCASCHRLIHRAIHLQRRWVGVAELRGLLGK